jgi:hypothetical protein
LELVLYAREVEDGQLSNQKRPVVEELHCGVNFSDYGFSGGEMVAIAIDGDNNHFICWRIGEKAGCVRRPAVAIGITWWRWQMVGTFQQWSMKEKLLPTWTPCMARELFSMTCSESQKYNIVG